jgi:hypothetical protein
MKKYTVAVEFRCTGFVTFTNAIRSGASIRPLIAIVNATNTPSCDDLSTIYMLHTKAEFRQQFSKGSAKHISVQIRLKLLIIHAGLLEVVNPQILPNLLCDPVVDCMLL